MSILSIPPPDASKHELIAHFRIVGSRFACIPYIDSIHLCQVCCRQGENVTGKEGNPGGRNRYCSDACEAVARAYEATHPKVGNNEATESITSRPGAKPRRARGHAERKVSATPPERSDEGREGDIRDGAREGDGD